MSNKNKPLEFCNELESKDSEGGASKTGYKKKEEKKEEVVDIEKVGVTTEKAIEEVVKDENVKKVEEKNTNKKVEVKKETKKEVVKESPKTTNNEPEKKSEVDGETGASQWN